MLTSPLRTALETLEHAIAGGDVADPRPALAAAAGARVELGEDETRAAVRRASLLAAAGGDPRRPLELDGRAVTALADDLASPARDRALAAGLDDVAAAASGLARVEAALAELRRDRGTAWRAFAAALLADALADT